MDGFARIKIEYVLNNNDLGKDIKESIAPIKLLGKISMYELLFF
jgi:hypothetical protein